MRALCASTMNGATGRRAAGTSRVAKASSAALGAKNIDCWYWAPAEVDKLLKDDMNIIVSFPQ